MKRLILTLLFCLLSAGNLYANTVRSAHTEVQLVSEAESVQPGKPFWVGLHLKMDKHWHVYWRNPGDSGIPVTIDWNLPEGFRAGEMQWPYPEKIKLEPLAVYAYEGDVLLPVLINAPEDLAAGSRVLLKARVRWLACEINCVPGEAMLELELPVRDATPRANESWVEAFSQARSRLPLAESDWDISVSANDSHLLIRARGNETTQELNEMRFFPYDPELIEHVEDQPFRFHDGAHELLVTRSKLKEDLTAPIQGILVSRDGWRGYGSEKALEVNEEILPLGETPVFKNEPKGLSLIAALLFAFAGGLILNLMPCVFPVLSIKVLGFVEQSKKSHSHIRLHGILFTLGVLVSFWLLAGLLISLRSAGQVIGWGFQLQSPYFVLFLCFLFFFFSLNLFGLFEIGTSLSAVGSVSGGGLSGAFFSGVLATVVATPCTAPFMGAALGFALSQPAAVSFAVFTSLGAGMALPYLLFSLFPALLKKLPQPGPWMVRLKQLLGLLLLLTVAWLAWVLSVQAGANIVTVLIGAFVVVTFAVWIFGRSQKNPGARAVLGWIVTVLLFSAAFYGPFHMLQKQEQAPQKVGASEPGGQAWVPYDAAKLEKLQSQGRPVFLDFTAAWCLTCQMNERVALNHPRAVAAFREKGITAMKADWTSRDESITRALASFGRTSIPLYVLFTGRAGEPPVILPEILTPNSVINAVSSLDSPEARPLENTKK